MLLLYICVTTCKSTVKDLNLYYNFKEYMKTIKKKSQAKILKLFFLGIIISLGFIDKVKAQNTEDTAFRNPPINAEVLLSNRGMTFQAIIDKKFVSAPKFGFFSVTNLVGEWDTNQVNDYMTQASLTYDLFKGFKLTGGFHTSSGTGMRPTVGVMYNYANQDWLIVAYPRVDLSKASNVEGLVLVEYKPKINDNWRLYSRIQCLYAYTMNIEKHTRSYIQARAGLSYKEFTFGVGTNIDYYGPIKHNENSFGGFVSVLLF